MLVAGLGCLLVVCLRSVCLVISAWCLSICFGCLWWLVVSLFVGCCYVGLRLVWLCVGLRFEDICVAAWVCGRGYCAWWCGVYFCCLVGCACRLLIWCYVNSVVHSCFLICGLFICLMLIDLL